METTTHSATRPDLSSLPSNRRGLPLSTTPRAAALYREAIERSHGAQAGVTELLEQAVASDPSFAVAQVARWMQADSDGNAQLAALAREAALRSHEGLTGWERGHIECIRAAMEGEADATSKARAHLQAYPLDLVVAFQLIGNLFFHGGQGKREAVMEILRDMAPHNDEDWAFLARLGFHTSELGDPEAAIEILDRALAAQAHAPFVAHAMGHALLESGRRAESHRFLLDWASRNEFVGPLDGHIAWHLSLGELESGAPEVAVERYLRTSAPGTSHCAAGLTLADAAGLFFRMRLDGASLDGMPRQSLNEFMLTLRGALKVPFVAVHAAALAVAIGDEQALAYLDEMATLMGGEAREAKNLVVTALKAHMAGDWQSCVDALERDRASAWEALGGSNEERALIAGLYADASGALARA